MLNTLKIDRQMSTGLDPDDEVLVESDSETPVKPKTTVHIDSPSRLTRGLKGFASPSLKLRSIVGADSPARRLFRRQASAAKDKVSQVIDDAKPRTDSNDSFGQLSIDLETGENSEITDKNENGKHVDCKDASCMFEHWEAFKPEHEKKYPLNPILKSKRFAFERQISTPVGKTHFPDGAETRPRGSSTPTQQRKAARAGSGSSSGMASTISRDSEISLINFWRHAGVRGLDLKKVNIDPHVTTVYHQEPTVIQLKDIPSNVPEVILDPTEVACVLHDGSVLSVIKNKVAGSQEEEHPDGVCTCTHKRNGSDPDDLGADLDGDPQRRISGVSTVSQMDWLVDDNKMKRRILRNVCFISVGFVALFSCLTSMASLQVRLLSNFSVRLSVGLDTRLCQHQAEWQSGCNPFQRQFWVLIL